jgi:beta-glucosidase
MSKRLVLAVALTIISVLFTTASAQYPFQDPSKSINDRAMNLLSHLTLDEKIDFLHWNKISISRLGISTTKSIESLHGAVFGGPANWGNVSTIHPTTFQQAYGLGAMWDTLAVKKAASLLADEVRYIYHRLNNGGLILRGPVLDLARDPRWGRTEESFGEDPFLNGSLGIAYIKGAHGEDSVYQKTSCMLKHFFGYGNEDDRTSTSADYDQRLFHEYYGVPFRMAISRAHADGIMTAYNAHNGTPCHVHPYIKKFAINTWGLNGIVCTDGGGFQSLIDGHHYRSTLPQGAAELVKAGTNSFLDDIGRANVKEALNQKLIKESDIDSVLIGKISAIIRLGLLDNPPRIPTTATEAPWLKTESKALARECMRKSVVLLKNANNLLPIRSSVKSIAVIGEKADGVFADWYCSYPEYTVSPLQGIKTRAGSTITVSYAKDNTNNDAVNKARSADLAIVVVGNHPTCNAGWNQCTLESEGKEAIDRKSIYLPGTVSKLILDVFAANRNTVLVLKSSFPYAIVMEADSLPAIIHITNSSQEEGNGLADVLFGDYNPAGRLVQTWPRSPSNLLPMMDYNIRNGRTYQYAKVTPLYCFGHGLSYTTFEYSNLSTSTKELPFQGKVTVSVDVKNAGARDGDEIVQLYVKHLNSLVSRPNKELKGFARVSVSSGETKTVNIDLVAEDLAYWDSLSQSLVVEKDKIELQIGASSEDIRLTKSIDVVNGITAAHRDNIVSMKHTHKPLVNIQMCQNTIIVNPDFAGKYTAALYDIRGRLFLQATGIAPHAIIFDHAMDKGCYILKIRSGSTDIVKKAIVK